MSSSTEYGGALSVPITALQYRDMSASRIRDDVGRPPTQHLYRARRQIERQ